MADSTWQMANGRWPSHGFPEQPTLSSSIVHDNSAPNAISDTNATTVLYCRYYTTILLYYYTSKMPALHPPRRVLYLGLSATDPSSNPPTSAHCSFMPRHHHAVLILLMLMLMLMLTTTTTTTTVLLLLLFFPCSTLLPFATA